MKAAALACFPSWAGFGLTAKILAAVFVVAGAAVSLAEKSYAPQTIQIDGRTFYFYSERNGAGDVFFPDDNRRGAARYFAGYGHAPELQEKMDAFHYQVFYDATPAPEFAGEDGAYSAYARMKHEWRDDTSGEWSDDTPGAYLYYQTRKTGGDFFRLSIYGVDGADLRVYGQRCGGSRKNAFICIAYIPWVRNDKYANWKEWTDAEGETHINRVYNALAEYPLSHNEELLADMAEMVK